MTKITPTTKNSINNNYSIRFHICLRVWHTPFNDLLRMFNKKVNYSFVLRQSAGPKPAPTGPDALMTLQIISKTIVANPAHHDGRCDGLSSRPRPMLGRRDRGAVERSAGARVSGRADQVACKKPREIAGVFFGLFAYFLGRPIDRKLNKINDGGKTASNRARFLYSFDLFMFFASASEGALSRRGSYTAGWGKADRGSEISMGSSARARCRIGGSREASSSHMPAIRAWGDVGRSRVERLRQLRIAAQRVAQRCEKDRAVPDRRNGKRREENGGCDHRYAPGSSQRRQGVGRFRPRDAAGGNPSLVTRHCGRRSVSRTLRHHPTPPFATRSRWHLGRRRPVTRITLCCRICRAVGRCGMPHIRQ